MNDDDNKDPFLKEKDEVDVDLIDGEVDVLDDDLSEDDSLTAAGDDDGDDDAPLWEEEE